MERRLPTVARRAGLEKSAKSVPWLRLAILFFVLVVLVAIIADMRRMRARIPASVPSLAAELQDILLGLGGPRYADPAGLFSVVVPAGWRTVTPPDSGSYNVVFYGPNGADMSIMATRVDYDDLPSLFKDIEKSEKQTSIRTDFEAFRFQGRSAVRRTCKLHHARVLAIDFVENRVAHHILFTAPPDLFEKYEPVLLEVLNTYQPGSSGAPSS